MSARTQIDAAFDYADDHQLADDIARAMHHRPLMSRLARVGAAHGEPQAAIGEAAVKIAPEPPPIRRSAPADAAADLRSLDEVIDDLGHAAAPPPSAEWLDNARRTHRQAQMRQAAAWATTLAIAVTIIGLALLLLRA